MSTIQITHEVMEAISAIRSTGKTPWAIATPTDLVGVYSNRTEAREAKSNSNLVGLICKISDLELEVAKSSVVVAPVKVEKQKAISPACEIAHKSEAINPCKLVWNIATSMKEMNSSVKRGAVLAECVAEGIAYYTARTQYQQWLTVQKEMAAREAVQASKKIA